MSEPTGLPTTFNTKKLTIVYFVFLALVIVAIVIAARTPSKPTQVPMTEVTRQGQMIQAIHKYCSSYSVDVRGRSSAVNKDNQTTSLSIACFIDGPEKGK